MLALAGACITPARADNVSVDSMISIPAAKIDNGLGSLPPLSEWRNPWLHATPAEKVDSGLGELPPLSQWRDVWLYAIPAEKIDNGLGEAPGRTGAYATLLSN
jgi:hypothetical protein